MASLSCACAISSDMKSGSGDAAPDSPRNVVVTSKRWRLGESASSADRGTSAHFTIDTSPALNVSDGS
jgi:hypothetical protein